jgi:hypothetical protein
MNLWTAEQKSNAQTLITYLLTERKRSDDGWPITKENLVAMSELGYSTNKMLRAYEVRILLQIMTDNNLTSTDDFERTYKQWIKDQPKDERLFPTWKMYIPIHAYVEDSVVLPFTITIMGMEFTMAKLDLLNDKSNIVRALYGFSKEYHEYQQGEQLYISINNRALSWDRALDNISSAFDVLRGVISYITVGGAFRLFPVGVTARAKIPHPYIMIVLGGDKPQEVMFMVDQKINPLRFTLRKMHIDKIVAMSKEFSERSQDITLNSLCIDSLRIYAQAMDAQFSYNCFLGLWQMAEAMTISASFGGNTDEVSRRLISFGGSNLVASGYSKAIKYFGELRNDLVHRGIHDQIHEENVDILHLACRNYFEWLMNNRQIFPTKTHLQMFYSLKDKGTADIEVTRDIVLQILNQARTSI